MLAAIVALTGCENTRFDTSVTVKPTGTTVEPSITTDVGGLTVGFSG